MNLTSPRNPGNLRYEQPDRAHPYHGYGRAKPDTREV
jgi:hypothetical protein